MCSSISATTTSVLAKYKLKPFEEPIVGRKLHNYESVSTVAGVLGSVVTLSKLSASSEHPLGRFRLGF